MYSPITQGVRPIDSWMLTRVIVGGDALTITAVACSSGRPNDQPAMLRRPESDGLLAGAAAPPGAPS